MKLITHTPKTLPVATGRVFYYLWLLVLTACQSSTPATEQIASLPAASLTPIVQNKPIKAPKILTPCERFDRLNTLVRDGKIKRQAAKDSIRKLLPLVAKYFYANGGKNYSRKQWIFPIQGYNKHFIGGKNGEGYVPNGYNYFDGNEHGGHPSHDIFIYDRNQDSIDDNTGKPVNTLSMSSGIVIAYDPAWKAGSVLEGGHYLWIYDPSTQGIFYYAHNSKLFVKPGDIVKPGQRIAHIGRTGKSASEKRSPTHLHITYLKVKPDGSLPPEDLYQDLLKCKSY
jgi:murein DD-endopeptidase MepM/ murein hydrolase activator NlpD